CWVVFGFFGEEYGTITLLSFGRQILFRMRVRHVRQDGEHMYSIIGRNFFA
ncbi:hypothetical protein VT99_12105, partial [Candidatus Electrothrix marina]